MATFGRFRSWPITAARLLEPQLRDMGLRVKASMIDGTSGDSSGGAKQLSGALVSVGPAGRGGTGSFISDDGLIITNWHVAHDAVRQAALAAGRDYLEEGFVARSRDEEVRGPNYEVWITRACVDVSEQVLAVVKSETDPLKRSNAVRDCTQAIAAKAEAEAKEQQADAGVRCDVQEMFPNETYVLFTQERLLDVRIVYVPPRALGNFGGDTDNFEWPRHTADFTLLRAYVGKDGAAAPFNEANIAYKPRARLRVCEKGASEGDFVFLLGFPGHTMRYAPASRLLYSDEVAVPSMIKDFGRKLALIAEHETHSPTAKLKLGGGKKSLANEHKRSCGKRVMMRKLNLIHERLAEEERLCEAAPAAKHLLARLEQIYAVLRTRAELDDVLEGLRGIYFGSALLAAGHALHEYSQEARKPDGSREAAYRERNLPFLLQRLNKRVEEIHEPFECALICDALANASRMATGLESSGDKASASALRAAFELFGVAGEGEEGASVDFESVRELTRSSKLVGASKDKLSAALSASEGKAGLGDEWSGDVFVSAAGALYATYAAARDARKALMSERDEVLAELLQLQRAQSSEAFWPDCNGSLRLSAGHVEGYSPCDAVRHEPLTTIEGLLDKAAEAQVVGADEEGKRCEFECPQRLVECVAADATAAKIPVCVLYSTDTVGGNSGSPVLNADGEFVAINFDRQRQGLMNEFKWSLSYSRSIGVDVRYILWLVGKYDNAGELVEEMLR